MVYITKRSGKKEELDISKIIRVLQKADPDADVEEIKVIANEVTNPCPETTEELRKKIESLLIEKGKITMARNYIVECYKNEQYRERKKLDEGILGLISRTNKDVMNENANKNPVIISTQRDLIAGEVNKDIARRYVFPKEVVEAHDRGVIHVHDMDYSSQQMTNCSLVNLEDMLQNGTIISGVKIDKPRSLRTAATVASQISAGIASSQYGGQTMSLSHLAPFVDISRQKYRDEIRKENALSNVDMSDAQVNIIAEQRVKREIKDSIQTLNYQWSTLQSTNGQSPFISLFLYLGEVDDPITKNDLALLIEEVFKQRIKGFKNKQGYWIAPTFPKLLYVLEEDNISEDSKYYYLTKLAAECITKRMVPDLISEKVMKSLKVDELGVGRCYAPMGCLDGDEVVIYKIHDNIKISSFEEMWNSLLHAFKVSDQPDGINKYMDLSNVLIYDKGEFVECKRIIKNLSNDWVKIIFSNGRRIDCTSDHIFTTSNGEKAAKDITDQDLIEYDKPKDFSSLYENLPKTNYEYINGFKINEDIAWFLGLAVCDSSYSSSVVFSLDHKSENDIIDNLKRIITNEIGLDAKVKLQERGDKGTYTDVSISKNVSDVRDYLISKFGKIKKIDRNVPKEILQWNKDILTSFLAGMIDADGYINNSRNGLNIVQIGSTNKKLAISQMYIAMAIGLDAVIYENRYSKNHPEKIRYRVEFNLSNDLLDKIVSKKKKSNVNRIERTNNFDNEFLSVRSIEQYEKDKFSYDVTTSSGHFSASGIRSHNCRSFLTPYLDKENKPKYYGRFNIGVVSLNLPYIAYESKGNIDEFWVNLDKYANLAFKAQMSRVNNLKNTISDVAPMMWQDGAIARLSHGEPIDKLFYDNYATISLGYMGIYETVRYLTGLSHTDERAQEFALDILKKLEAYCDEWYDRTRLRFSLYGTPAESLTDKFSKAIRRDFDPGFKSWVTNSFHVDIEEEIDAFSKLKLESLFQSHSPGGVISYVEVPNLQKNPEAIIALMKFMYDNVMYSEINTKVDVCGACGYQGEIELQTDEEGNYFWECPNCLNRDTSSMSIVRRVCGYLGDMSNGVNYGRLSDIAHRALHL